MLLGNLSIEILSNQMKKKIKNNWCRDHVMHECNNKLVTNILLIYQLHNHEIDLNCQGYYFIGAKHPIKMSHIIIYYLLLKQIKVLFECKLILNMQ